MHGFQPFCAEASVTAAHRAAPQWAKLRHAERASVLMSCADTLRSNLEALATSLGRLGRLGRCGSGSYAKAELPMEV